MSPTCVDDAPPLPGAWQNSRARAIVWQAVVVASLCAFLAMVAVQTASNLKLRGIASGFGYLGRAAGFEIAPGPLSYSSRDTYARALGLGLVNTLEVSMLGILIASALGLLIGVARLSNIWIVSTTSRLYVEVLRNTPLLLQLLFWYSLSQALPGTHDALNPVSGVFLSQRGLFLPRLHWQDGSGWPVGALFVLVILVALIVANSRQRSDRSASGLRKVWLLTLTAAVVSSTAIAIGQSVITLDRPAPAGFDFRGGTSISTEFAALLFGLSTYTAAFIGEIVRGGILAVDRGQTEAAAALGFSRLRILRLVVLPQALPVIVPPATSQFLNLAKNSSLAVAIGYPDLLSVTNTTLNQTGQALEAVAIAATIYLGISLTISFAMTLASAVSRRGRGGRRPW